MTGFLIPAMASEVNHLSEEEKLVLIRSTVEICNNNCTVSTLNGMLRLGETYLKEGCKGILANIPYQSTKKYRESAKAMDALKPEFLMLQDWDASGYGIPVDYFTFPEDGRSHR